MTQPGRWRRGETNPVVAPVRPDIVVWVGDLVYLYESYVLPAANLDADVALLQRLFHDRFLGVALTPSPHGTSGGIRIATTGTFEFELPSYFGWQPVELGTRVGPRVNDTLLCSQTVIPVADCGTAVGRVSQRRGSHDPLTLFVDICSTIMYGGPQEAA